MDGFDRLAASLQSQTKKMIGGSAKIQLEVGTITTDFGLSISRFPTAIPKGEYLIDKRLSINYKPETTITTSSAEGHTHSVSIPLLEGIAQIQPGENVLVCWNGADAIVVSVLTDSNNIGEEGSAHG